MNFTYKHTKYACYISYIAGAVINNIAPLLFVIFQNSFGVSLGQLAFLITANFATQAIVDFLGARYVNKIGYRKMVIIAEIFAVLGLIGLGTFPYVMPNPYTGIVMSAICYAVGSGLLEVMISPIIEGVPENDKSGNMSLLHSFYCWGSVLVIIVTTLFIYIFGRENWRYLCYMWAVVPVIALGLFCFVPINPIGTEEGSSFKNLFSHKVLWLFMLLMLCSGASELSMSQWASYFAETALGVSKAVGDILGACSFAILMGISRVLYGMFSEKLDLKKFMLGSAALCVASYCLTAFSANEYVSMLGCAICGFSVGIMWPGALSMAAEKHPAGGAPMFGILALSGDIGCSLGPQLTAVISENVTLNGSGLKAGFFGSIIFPVVLIVTVLIINRKGVKQHQGNQR